MSRPDTSKTSKKLDLLHWTVRPIWNWDDLNFFCDVSRICEEFSQVAKGKVVHGSNPDRVTCERHPVPLSLHYTEREVCAARLPASRSTLLSNTRAAQPYGRTPLATPCLERAGPPHARAGPIPGAPSSHLPSPARVTGGRYPAQMRVGGLVVDYIRSGGLECKADGFSV